MSNQKITLNVPDMHCPSCPKLITMDLEDTKGILKIETSLENKTVTVEFNPEIIDIPLIIETIKKSGYSAKIIN